MLLVQAEVGPFKSIDSPQLVKIDPAITVLVGMNEAGKTVFLQALEKSRDVLGIASFDVVNDYPRKDLSQYLKAHEANPKQVTSLTYELNADEIGTINETFKTSIQQGFHFTVNHDYKNNSEIDIDVDEKSALDYVTTTYRFSTDAASAVSKAKTIRELPGLLKSAALTEEDKQHLAAIEQRVNNAKWESVIGYEVWQWLSSRIPTFLYFSDYDILPSKMNLADLASRTEQAKSNPSRLGPQHRAVLALLRMADISVSDFTTPGGYEEQKAKIEGVSISLTDQIMEFWKQNENLEVEVDIKPDPQDEPPYNSGSNLYLRIKNRRHRGVSTPFQQRSRGFIWFFSFLVWFDSVRHQLNPAASPSSRDLVLLLDEPGLALHALAQSDFLRYIDKLSGSHQVIYSTHSPFMIHSDRMYQIRLVEDKIGVGTTITDTVSGSDPRTLFPLQAALGWTIAQNLFISKRNLLVEGPSELVYLQYVSSVLEQRGAAGLREDITVVPVGGLDKVATFVALLGANELELAVFHDYAGAPDQRLGELIKQKIIAPKLILNASRFRDASKFGVDGIPTDIEDLFDQDMYVDYFKKAYSAKLQSVAISTKSLPPGDRIVERLARFVDGGGIALRPSGGFNHYVVASEFGRHPPTKLGDDVLQRFEELFKTVNSLYSK